MELSKSSWFVEVGAKIITPLHQTSHLTRRRKAIVFSSGNCQPRPVHWLAGLKGINPDSGPPVVYCIQHFALLLVMYDLGVASWSLKTNPWGCLSYCSSYWLHTTVRHTHRRLLTLLCDFAWPTILWLNCFQSNHFHVVIRPLTAKSGVFNSKEISKWDFLQSRHGITLKFSELLRSTNVRRSGLHASVLNF